MRRDLVRTEPWLATIEAASLRDLRREIGRAHRRGELAASGPVHQLERGGYFVNVLRLRDRPVVPAWRRPVLVVGGVLLTLVAAAAAGWWLMLATAPFLPALAGGAAVLALLSAAAAPRPAGCTITITHRRH